MSQTIDDRIVQLEFDNKDFEKNVSESLQTLQQLKTSLDLEKSAKNLSAITEASKKVDFSHLSDSIDQLNEKFSTMRMVGMMALSNIVDGAMNAAKKLGSALMSPINQMATGGWARAANLEQANFMMEGFLHDSTKVAEVMRNVDEAVSGTAYSLDEAAKAAAQFAVSGVSAGEDMEGVLKAVAGTAAMTGSSFSDISDIFTSIAGNGKVTKMQLNQLAFRGMNAAAVMAEYFETTEEEIRDMVHHGEVSFEMFSEAMQEAFGEHAKDANNTFQGALANMKSALNRIGAEFAKPIMRDAIPVFNSLRLMINSMKANLGDVIWVFDKISHAVSTKLISGINKITEFFKGDSFRNNGLKDLNEAFTRTVISLVKIGKAISEAFKTVFNGSLGDHINNLCKGINNISKVLAPTETGLQGFKAVLTIILTVIKKVGQAVGFVITKVGGPLLKVIANIVKGLFSLIGIITKIVSAIGDFIRQSGILENIIFAVEVVVYEIIDRFDEFKRQLSDTSTTVGKVADTISKAFKAIAAVVLTVAALPILTIYRAFEKLRSLDFKKLLDALTNFKNLLIEGFEYIKELPIVQAIIEGVQYAFFGLVGVIGYVIISIQEFITKLAEGEITLETIKERILNIPNAIKNTALRIRAFFSGNSILAKVMDVLGNIGNFLKGVFSNIKNAFKELTPAKAMLFAFAMSMLSMSLIFNKLGITITNVLRNADIGLGILKVRLKGGLFQIDKYTAFATALAEALIALSISFYVLGKYVPRLKEVAITFGLFMGAMVGLSILSHVVDKLLGVTDGFRVFVWNMAVMATSIAAISFALKMLSEVTLDDIAPKIGLLAVIMGALIGVSFIISHFGDKATLKTVLMLVAFAASVVAVCYALRALDNINLRNIKGAWPELLAILVGIGAIAAILGKISTILIGSIALLTVLIIFVKRLYDVGVLTSNKSEDIVNVFWKFRQNIHTVFDQLSRTVNYIWGEIKSLDTETKIAFVVGIILTLVAFVGIIRVAFRKIGAGILAIAKDGKYIKKVGSAFLMFAVGIAGLMYVSKLLGEWIKENPNVETAIQYIIGMMAVTSLIVAFCTKAEPKAVKAASKVIASLGIAILSIGLFAALIGTLKKEEFDRAVMVLGGVLVVITVLISVIAICSALAKQAPAGFGTFAGLTLLFSAMIGTIAWLMIALKDKDDYIKLGAAVLSIIILFSSISLLMWTISKIHVGVAWKPIIAVFGGLAAIGIAIAVCANLLPDEHYIGKVASISIAMVALLTAMMTAVLLLHKFAKDKKYSLTKGSTATLKMIFAGIGELILGLVAIAAALWIVKDQNPLELAARALVLVGIITALVGIMYALNRFMNKNKLKGLSKDTIKGLIAFTAVFAAIALVVGVLEYFGGTADRILAVSQVVMLVLFELAAIVAALSFVNKKMKLVKAATIIPALLGLTAIFAVLAIVIGVLENLGGTADRMLAVSQVVMLVLFELAAIVAAISLLIGGTAGIGAVAVLLSAAAIPALLGLALVMYALGVAIAAVEKVGGTADRMLAVSQVLVLVILELSVILVILAVVGLLWIPAMAAEVCLLGLVGLMGILAIILTALTKIPIENGVERFNKLTEILYSIMKMLGILSLIGLNAVGALAGSAALLMVVASLKVLLDVIRGINEIGTEQIAIGLEQIANALQLLSSAGVGLMVLAAGLGALSIGIAAVGIACLVAAPGILSLGYAFSASIVMISGALSTLESAMNSFVSILNTVKQAIDMFFTDVANSFINSPAVQMAARGAEEAAKLIAGGFDLVFRNILGWESPPKIITGFLSDAASAFLDSPAAQACINAAKKIADFISKGFEKVFRDNLGWHSWPKLIRFFLGDGADAFINSVESKGFVEAAKEEADRVTGIFGDTFENFDIGKICEQFGLDGIAGLTNGVIGGEGNLFAELNNVLGATNAWASQMESALSRGYGTLSDFQYQLDDAVAAAKNKYDQLYKEAEYFNRISPNSVAAQNAKKNRDEAYKSWKDAEYAANNFGKTIDEVTEEEEEYIDTTGKATSATKDFVDSLESTLASQMNIFSKFEAKNPMNKEELLNNMRSQIKGMTDWAGQMNKLAEMGIDQGLYKKLAEMGPQGAEYVGAFTAMTAEELAQANEMWAQSLVLPGDVARQIGANFNEMGKNVPGSFATGINEAVDEAVDATQNLSTTTYDTMHDGEWQFGSPSYTAWKMGYWIDLGLGHGILENMHFAIRAIETMCNLMVDKARRLLDPENFKPIGAGIVEGVHQGIEENMSILETAMEKLAAMVEKAARSKDGFDVNSPSKRMIPIGEGVGEGLALGIDRSSQGVVSSITSMSDVAVAQMKQTIANIATMINDEMEDPVITPVLDLSKVQAGARLLNSTFSANAAIAAGGSQLGALQNGQYSSSGITFNQYNNSPKALSRIDIYRDTRNMLSQFKQVTM